jgi:hypothetical protein
MADFAMPRPESRGSCDCEAGLEMAKRILNNGY